MHMHVCTTYSLALGLGTLAPWHLGILASWRLPISGTALLYLDMQGAETYIDTDIEVCIHPRAYAPQFGASI